MIPSVYLQASCWKTAKLQQTLDIAAIPQAWVRHIQ